MAFPYPEERAKWVDNQEIWMLAEPFLNGHRLWEIPTSLMVDRPIRAQFRHVGRKL